MTTLAIFHPTNLLGKEIHEALEGRKELWSELLLLSTIEDEVGSLTSVRGSAAVVQRWEADSLNQADLVFLCGPEETYRQVLENLPAGITVVVTSYEAGPEVGRPLVAGVNLQEAYRGEILASPHPAVVGIAQLLHPLLPLGARDAVATVIQPASMHNQAGLDELFEQTRAVLAFAPNKPREVFGQQMAFNLLPPSAPTVGPVEALLAAVLGTELRPSVQLIQGGVFHGLSVSLRVCFAEDPGIERIREVLAAAPEIEAVDEEELLGPIDAANRDQILLGSVRPDPSAEGGYWIWATFDNLTHGGGANALAIAAAVLKGPQIN